jgi:hypothetical protein
VNGLALTRNLDFYQARLVGILNIPGQPTNGLHAHKKYFCKISEKNELMPSQLMKKKETIFGQSSHDINTTEAL